MRLNFIGDCHNYYFVKRILDHDEELTIGHLQLNAFKPNSLTYLHWNPLDHFSFLPKDEQEQITNFIEFVETRKYPKIPTPEPLEFIE